MTQRILTIENIPTRQVSDAFPPSGFWPKWNLIATHSMNTTTSLSVSVDIDEKCWLVVGFWRLGGVWMKEKKEEFYKSKVIDVSGSGREVYLINKAPTHCTREWIIASM